MDVVLPQAVITIPSLNPPDLRRCVKEGPNLRIVPLPTLGFTTLRRLVRENDLVLPVEGSLLPGSLGNPPILTIIAMAKRVSKICRDAFGRPSF